MLGNLVVVTYNGGQDQEILKAIKATQPGEEWIGVSEYMIQPRFPLTAMGTEPVQQRLLLSSLLPRTAHAG